MTTEYEKAMDAQPVAWVAADTLSSPHPVCISSLAYMSQLDRERGREYVPLYAAPVAAQGEDDARDAERYRLLRRKVSLAGGEFHIRNLDPRYVGTDSAVKLDAAIAALSAAQPPAEAQAQDIGPEWKPCRKRPVIVHVREQRPGEQHVSTREGITAVKPDDLIMRGVEGEEYPIGRELFNKTYDLVDEAQAQGGGPLLSTSEAVELAERTLANALGHDDSALAKENRND